MDISNKDIREAKDFLVTRLAAQRSIRHDVEVLLNEYAKKLVAICYELKLPAKKITFDYNSVVRRKVREIISKLEDLLYQDIEYLCTYKWKDKHDSVVVYMNREISSKTLKDRVGEYSSMFEKEIEAMSVACRWAGKSENDAAILIGAALAAPYMLSQFREAVNEGGFDASRIRTHGYSKGVGKTNVSFNGITSLASYTISDVWMHFFMEDAAERGAVGFVSYRGSSYPCYVCDDYTGYHDISEYDLPLHPNCCCYPVFIY